MPSNLAPLRTITTTTRPEPRWWFIGRDIGPEVTLVNVDTDGPHSFDVHPVGGASVTIGHSRSGVEDAGAVVDAWAVAATALLGSTLKGTIQAAKSNGLGQLYLTPVHDDGVQAQPFVVDNFVAPGAATIAVSPTGEFPITGVMPSGSAYNGVEFSLRMLDGSGELAPEVVTSFADFEVLVNDTRTGASTRQKRIPSHRVIMPIRCEIGPGIKFSLRLACAVSQPPPTMVALAVDWTPVQI